MLPQGLLTGSGGATSRPLVGRHQAGHRAKELDQYLTPEWAAEALVERLGLRPEHRVVDVGTGLGAFLKPIPQSTPAVGIEIDPEMAEWAVLNTDRPVIVSDFRVAELPFAPTHVIGNPPFEKRLIDDLIRWVHARLEEGGCAAFLLPGTHLRFAQSVLAWRAMFSIEQVALPADLFPRARFPFSWVTFTKNRAQALRGFVLFEEADEVNSLSRPAKLVLMHGKPRVSAWKAVVAEAMTACNGRAALSQLNAFIAGRKPRSIATWKATVRRVVQEEYIRVAPGVWSAKPAPCG